MGLETALAVSGGASVVGSALQYGENRAARKRAQKASDAGSAIASQPTINIGQDSLLQQLRANPGTLDPFMFDTSKAYAGYAAQDKMNLQDQVNQLGASAGSLGARFGSGFAAKSALLRQRVLADTGARNAGIAQSSFNSGIGFGLQDQQQKIGLLQLIQQGQFQQRGQQLQALGLGASVPGTGAGQLVSQSGADIGNLALLMSVLGNKKTGGTAAVPTPAGTTYGGGWPG